MDKNTKNFKRFYTEFKPPSDWDKLFDSKEYSLYYQLLLKHQGLTQADKIWHKRDELYQTRNIKDSFYELYEKVKNYKPKDKISLLTDLSWGYETILDNERRNKSRTNTDTIGKKTD